MGSQNPDLSLVLSSCEPELQELMRQIDIMISQQRDQWEAEIRTFQVQLKTTQEELATSRELLQRKELEIALLQKQQESTKTDRKELISKYEQLQKVSEELNKLKKSYHKLQHKHMKQDTGAKDSDLSEMSRLKEKIEEHQRRSIDWEQQCVQYQKQLTSVETQNKSLTQEISLLKSQRSLLKEPEHKECCFQLQRLRTQLEKTQSSLFSHELELEQLRPLEVWLGQYHREQKAAEREELHASLDSQDSFVRRSGLERPRLRNEATRLNQLLQAKDQVIRSLEDCLAVRGGAGVESIRLDLEKTTAELQSAQASETELRTELSSLRERLETVSRQKEDQSKTEQDLKSIKAEYESCTAEMKKLREELQRAQQTHSGEVERMRQKVSKLTSDLHQRDHTISSHSGALSGVAEQLRGEQQRAQQRNDELRSTQAQLDVLREENLHLKSLLQRQDSRSPKSPVLSLNCLQQALSASNSSSQEKLHTAVPRDHTDPKTVREQGSGSSHEGEIQRLFQQLQVKPRSSSTGSDTSRGQSPAPSCSSSSGPNPDRRNSASSDSAAEGSTHSRARERGTGAESLPPSPSAGMVSRFLEEESLRSSELLQRLDSHIHNMTESNTRTVSKYLPSAAATQD